jgi:molybdate transport system substrate-binding protein
VKRIGIGLVLAGVALSACADEIRVISGGAARAFVEPTARSFPGHEVKLDCQPLGRLVQSLAAGQPADMIIVTSEVLQQLEAGEKIAKGSGRPLARVGIGVAVNEKAPLPDISTPAAFRRTLLAAKSIVYIDPKAGTSGQGGHIVEPVGRGEIEFGIHQISEILPVKGVKLVGELPPELQKYTVYVAAPTPSTGKSALVQQLMQHLGSTSARERLAQAGYTLPE